MSKLAIIQIRGSINAVAAAKNALDTLNLDQKHACVIRDDTSSVRGVLQQVKDYVTWGEVSEETIEALNEARDGPVYHLNSPNDGFDSVKQPIAEGGALGERDDMDELIRRML